jgi:hypothetical protein
MRPIALAAAALAVCQPAAMADTLTLTSAYWGDPSAWSGGQLPENTDDVAFTRSTVFLATPGLAAVQAQVRNVEATGRQLVFAPGASLNAVRLQGGNLDMAGGLLAIRGARLPGEPDNETYLGNTTIRSAGLTPSIMTVVGLGTVRFGATTSVDGTLDLRGLGRFVNPAGSAMTVRNNQVDFDQTGSLALNGEVKFFNDGLIDIQGPSQIANFPSPNSPGTRFVNGATGAIEASDALGIGTTLGLRTDIFPYVENAGRIAVASGRLTLVNGGSHGDAQLEASGTGMLELWGSHEILGNVSVLGSGIVEMGGIFATTPSSLTVTAGATLSTGVAQFFQSAPMTVADGGTVSNSGSFYVSDTLTIQAGGELAQAGFMQLAGNLENSGTVSLAGSGSIIGQGSYVQHGGSTTIGGSTTLDLTVVPGQEGSFLQYDGTTTVNGLVRAGSVEFLGGTVQGSGTIEYLDSLTSAVTFGAGLTVQPGNSPGILTINGNLDAAGAIFDIEVAGLDAGISFDQLVVNGDANLEGAFVNFRFIDGFLPTPGDIFNWLVVSGGAQGLETLAVKFFSDAGVVDGFLTFDGSLFVTEVTPVPLPPAAWALGSGLLALAAVRRRRRPDQAAA